MDAVVANRSAVFNDLIWLVRTEQTSSKDVETRMEG
jgi:hypothetical protein